MIRSKYHILKRIEMIRSSSSLEYRRSWSRDGMVT